MNAAKQAMSDTGPERPSPQLLRGMAVAWVGIVALVSLCIFLGVGWAFRGSSGPSVTQAAGLTQRAAVTTQAAVPGEPPTATPGPTSVVEPTTAPNQDRSFGYGIEVLAQQDVKTMLDQVQALGMEWIKYQIDWASMEPEPGAIQWDRVDAVMAAASAHNFKVLLDVASAPDWTRSVTSAGKNGPPDDPQRYAAFLTQIVQRYQGSVHAIEIWDEQNLDREWYTAGGLSPAGYMSLLVASSQAVRQIDPGIMLISGALTPTGRNDGVMAIDDFRYMREMIDAGLLDYVDCVGARHIGFNLSPTITAEDAFFSGMPPGTQFVGPYDAANPVNPHHSWSFISTLTGYHSMIVASGRDTPLCVTEFGWASAEGIGEAAPDFEFAYDNTPQGQAEYIVQAFQTMHDWGFVRLGILFNLDYALNEQGAGQDFGALFSILLPDGSPRPAFEAVRDMPKPP